MTNFLIRKTDLQYFESNRKGAYNMKLQYPLNIKNPIEELLQVLISNYKVTRELEIKKIFSEQCALLINVGYDFYDLLSLYMNFAPFSKSDCQTILSLSPVPQRSFSPEINNIRKAISRWTCSKYHTATIDEVIKDIHCKIDNQSFGIYQYNSNLNNKNRRSLNDLYILIIAEHRVMWYDINKKVTIEFVKIREVK